MQAPIIGTVLNGVTAEGTYGYSYRYTYAADDADTKARRDKKPTVKEAAGSNSGGG